MNQHPESNRGGAANPEVMESLELYLDGMLTGEKLAAFERLLAADAALRRHVEAHRAMVASLRARMAPPEAIEFPALDRAAAESEAPAAIPMSRGLSGAGGAAGTRHAPMRIGRWVGYAAAAMIGVVGVLWWSSTVPSPSARPVLTAAEVLATTRQGGFKPVFVCKDDAEFVEVVRKRFGTGLLIASTESIAVLGWAYSDTYGSDIVSKDTLVLMARVDGREVLVFMDRAPGEHVLKQGDSPEGYRLFSKTLGGLVLYEFTPFETPRVLQEARVVEGGVRP